MYLVLTDVEMQEDVPESPADTYSKIMEHCPQRSRRTRLEALDRDEL